MELHAMEASRNYPNIYDSVKDFISLANEGLDIVLERRKFLKFKPGEEKDNLTSEMLWKQANNLAEKEQYFEAVILYTESIRYAKEKTEIIVKAYIKRAEALYKLSCHEECVQDYQRAEDNAGPNNIMCENNLYRQTAEDITVLKFPPDRPLPEPENKHRWIDCAANCIDLVQSETGRRYFIANTDISVGELLAVDKPVAVGAHSDDKLFCHECGMNCMNPIPCQKCTIVQYCDTPCREAAWDNYHKYECLILPTLEGFIKKVALALKIAFRFETYKTEEQSEEPQEYDPYKEIINLEVDVSKHHEVEVFNIQMVTGLTFLVVKSSTSFFEDVASRSGLTEAEVEKIFRALFLKLVLIKKTYFRTVSKKSIIQGEIVFKGEYDEARAFRSLLKHSCVPNVALVQIDNALIARAILPIKKGEPLVIEFCQSFIDVVTGFRQIQLQLKGMKCFCKACMKRWPDYSRVRPADELMLRILETIEEFIETKRFIFTVFERIVVTLGEMASKTWIEPSKEFYTYFRTARKCFEFLDERICVLPCPKKPCYEIEEQHNIWGINWDYLKEEIPDVVIL